MIKHEDCSQAAGKARKSSFQRLLTHSAAMLAGLALWCTVGPAEAAEYRAFWVDGWGAGFLNQSQVDNLLGVVGDPNSKGTLRNANCNMVIVQVRRRFDVCYPSGVGEPYFSGLSPANFNALQAMINAAHDTTGGKKRIEVHCWQVTFATDGGQVYNQHIGTPTGSLTSFDNYWPTRDDAGVETDDKAFDPGHPLALQYVVNASMDLVNNFDIDGLHYDYIRFTANNQGFNPTSIARYNAKYGLTGQPAYSSEQFKQWRRDQVSAVVRQIYARIQKSKPWVKQSGSFVTWNPSPTASTRAAFQATRPYYDVYSDWDSWMQEGIVDMGVPMTYYNWASLPNDYTRWMNFEKDRKFNRHMIIGPGIYLNSLDNAILVLQKTRDASPAGNHADGFSGYSYRVPYNGGTWAGFSPSLLAQVTPTWDDLPDMPWKSAPTKGHMMGVVTFAGTGTWADGATVSITGPASRTQTVDGTGFYAFIDLPPGSYTVTASKSGYPNAQAMVNVAVGAVTGNMYEQNLVLGGTSTNFTLTVSATAGGSVTRNPDQPNYPPNTTVTLTAAPEAGFAFTGWSGDAGGSANPLAVLLTTDKTITANFASTVTDIILDNTSPAVTFSGSWQSGTQSTDKYSTDYRFASTVAGGTSNATYTPNIGTAGYYDVYIWYPQGSNRATNAPWQVVYYGGSTSLTVDQTVNGGGWRLIAPARPFRLGTAGYVRVSNNSIQPSKVVMADAVRLTYVAPLTLPSTTTTLNSSANPSVYGNAVTLTATVTSSGGTPGGTVSFTDGATVLGTAALDGSGQAVLTTSDLSAAGSPHFLTAVYAGDSSFSSSTSSALSQGVIGKTVTVTGLTAQNKVYNGTTAALLTGTPALSGVVAGDVVSLTGTAIGTFSSKTVGTGKTVGVTGLSLTGTDSGNYTLTLPTLSANITAAGLAVTGLAAQDKVYDGTTVATLIGSPALSGVFGSDIVSLTGTPAGVFADANVGTAKTVSISGLGLTGADAGNYSLAAPTATASITGAPTTTALTTSINPSGPGTNVLFTATVGSAAGTPAGAVVFMAGGVPFSTNALLGGATAVGTASLPLGTNTIRAEYALSGNFLASAGTLEQVVKLFITCSQTNSVLGMVGNPDNTFTLSFVGTPQAEYFVLASPDLGLPASNWLPLAGSTNKAGNPSGLWQFTVTNAGTQQFYRAAAVAPCP